MNNKMGYQNQNGKGAHKEIRNGKSHAYLRPGC